MPMDIPGSSFQAWFRFRLESCEKLPPRRNGVALARGAGGMGSVVWYRKYGVVHVLYM